MFSPLKGTGHNSATLLDLNETKCFPHARVKISMGEFTEILILRLYIKIWKEIKLSPYQLPNAELFP